MYLSLLLDVEKEMVQDEMGLLLASMGWSVIQVQLTLEGDTEQNMKLVII